MPLTSCQLSMRCRLQIVAWNHCNEWVRHHAEWATAVSRVVAFDRDGDGWLQIQRTSKESLFRKNGPFIQWFSKKKKKILRRIETYTNRYGEIFISSMGVHYNYFLSKKLLYIYFMDPFKTTTVSTLYEELGIRSCDLPAEYTIVFSHLLTSHLFSKVLRFRNYFSDTE